MADSYIPASDADALAWYQTFALAIQTNPATYDLVAADATAIDGAVDAFAAAFAIAINPATRTPVAVSNKDAARASADEICRQYASLIKFNAGVSDAAKIAIGVPPPNDTRSPIPAPDTSPLLNIIAVTPGIQTLRYSDSATPDSGKKPNGVTSLQLFVAVGTAPVTDPEVADFHAVATRNPVPVPFDAADDGKMATYFARWANAKGQVGPWSLPVHMRIAA